MFKNAKKIIRLTILLCFLLGCLVVWALGQPKLIADSLLSVLKKHPSAVVFKEINIDSIYWRSWQQVELRNVRIKCKIKGESYLLSSGTIQVEHLKGLFDGKPLLVYIKNLAVVSDKLNFSDVMMENKFYFQKLRYKRSETSFDMVRAEWNEYVVENVKGNLKDQANLFELSQVEASLYGGEARLTGWASYANTLSYEVDIKLKAVHSTLLAKANPSFAQMTAIVDGRIKLEDPHGQGLMIQADVGSPQGGSMKASLLRYLVQYVPQRKQVEQLIAKDADVDLSKMQFKMVSVGPETISAEVVLNSSSLNLNMDVKFDINMDGGIAGLLEYTTSVSQ
jgi:hypothetical protein